MDLLIVEGKKPIKHDCDEKEEKIDFITSYLKTISKNVTKEEDTSEQERREDTN